MRRAAAWLIVLAVALRLPGLWSDLWLDEIWALNNVGALATPLGVFTGIHHDSNHWLISLWMYAVGQDAGFWVYRLPSLVAGAATVALAGWLARADESSPGLAALLVAVSFPLGFYASEARGYALAACAALAGWGALTKWLRTGQGRWLAAHGVASSLGVLAHLSFVAVVAAEAIFVLALVARRQPGLGARRMFLPFLSPLVVLLALFALDLRHLQLGGGPPLDVTMLLVELGSLALGGPVDATVAPVIAIAGAAAVGAALAGLVRGSASRPTDLIASTGWVFYAAVIILPVLVAVAMRPPFLFPRYFLVALVFVPLLLAGWVGRLRKPMRMMAVGAVVLLNAWSWMAFAGTGRGHYAEALRDITRASSGPATVSGDHEFRVRTVVEFYLRRAPATPLAYAPAGGDFFIDTSGRVDEAPPSGCDGCVLLGSYSSSPLSGTPWRVYQRSRRFVTSRP